jgi:hypothetical protein
VSTLGASPTIDLFFLAATGCSPPNLISGDRRQVVFSTPRLLLVLSMAHLPLF